MIVIDYINLFTIKVKCFEIQRRITNVIAKINQGSLNEVW